MLDASNFKSIKILWISQLVLDIHLHKTSQIEVLRGLTSSGYQVFFNATYSKKKDLNELANLHSIVFPLRDVPFISQIIYVLILLIYMPIFILREKPDVVIVEPSFSFLSIGTTLFFPKSLKPKIILDIRSTPVGIVGINGYFTNLFFKLSIYAAKIFFQGITIITKMMKKQICKSYSINEDFVGVWTSGVQLDIFNPDLYSKKEMRKKVNLDDVFIVFYHGVISDKRGIIDVVNAIDILKNKYSNIVLFLLGAGKLNLLSIIHELHLEEKVIVYDSVSYFDVPKYISIADIGIVPLPNVSDWRYQCPLKLLEYLAMKKVVIATDIPANREILGDSPCGIYVNSLNPSMISDAIIYAYENQEFLKIRGEYGRKIIENKYSWMKVAKEFGNFISKIYYGVHGSP